MPIAYLSRHVLAPQRLLLRTMPFSHRQLLLRLGGALLLLWVGWEWGGRSWLLGGFCLIIALPLGIPWNWGESLILDRQRDQVIFWQHRLGIPRRRFRRPLSQIREVRLRREAREVIDKYAEDAFLYRCQVYLHFQSGEELPVFDLTSPRKPYAQDGDPRPIAQKLKNWIDDFLPLSR
ncbi:MAG: hypothetical protein NW237_01170 [Cyanobacteriota bacterium]|nr:hypothetical protein [Cyanobacteriota bacterium]